MEAGPEAFGVTAVLRRGGMAEAKEEGKVAGEE